MLVTLPASLVRAERDIVRLCKNSRKSNSVAAAVGAPLTGKGVLHVLRILQSLGIAVSCSAHVLATEKGR